MSEISKLILGFIVVYFLVQFLPNISVMSTKNDNENI